MQNKANKNRLIHEKSPYLRQHAHNPVDWYPWSDEAFDKAKREDRLVFLSIGYSTCHWCHVMERESFEDEEAADYLNRHFVSVKVDREERPDIDAVYMRVTQALTGRGGWPMTVFLTPDKNAFYAGTYFPKRTRYGVIGLLDILASIVKLWQTDREKLVRQGTDIPKQLDKQKSLPPEAVSKNDQHTAVDLFRHSFDAQYGGFEPPPKFPMPHNFMFLLRYYNFEHREEALKMTETTLRSMYRGGLFDHIGGGFSRYSTDAKWHVPHFEKMLYDNALLVISYLEAYQVTKKELYRRVAEKTLSYVQREMTHPDGGFFSAQDADSEGTEGLYYVMRPETVKEALGETDGTYFCRWFGISDTGDFEGASIPNLLDNEAYDGPPDARIEALLPRIYDDRLKQTKLFKDEKILTAWNALMIAAFAKAYRALGIGAYRTAAERAAAFVGEKLTRPDGRLYVRWHDGEAAGTGYLDDYAYTAWAMLHLYEATYDILWLETAVRHAETLCDLFEDRENGGFYLYASDGEQLMLRPKETYDGALPSGNAVAAYVLLKLYRLTAEDKWEKSARKQMAFLSAHMKEYPMAHSFGLTAAQLELYPSEEVIAAAASDDDLSRLKKELGRDFAPNRTILVKTAENENRLAAAAPFTKDYPVKTGKTLYYICKNHTCSAPIASFDELIKRLTGQSAPARS